MSGIERIAAERQRQIDEEGWTPLHDDDHVGDELVRAGIAYAYTSLYGNSKTLPDPLWPWLPEWWKPSDDRIRNLEKAGALIAAEIDRLERQKEPSV